jgi:hypothetical protein
MSDLKSKLEAIAEQFVTSVLEAMQSASLGDLAGQTGRAGRPAPAPKVSAATAPIGRRGRRHRATAAQVQKQKDTALAVAKTLKPGFSKGDVMKKSGAKVDLGRALSVLVAAGKLSRKGDRRLARYWVK